MGEFSPERTLAALRWDVDRCVWLHEYGGMWWLKPCCDAAGERIGITACCSAEDPCTHHAAIARTEG